MRGPQVRRGSEQEEHMNQVEDGQILGVNTRWLPSLSPDLDHRVGYCVVLVAGAIDDYAAYAGLVRGDDGNPTASEIEFIKRSGNKVRFEEAQCHFPGSLKQNRYRE